MSFFKGLFHRKGKVNKSDATQFGSVRLDSLEAHLETEKEEVNNEYFVCCHCQCVIVVVF